MIKLLIWLDWEPNSRPPTCKARALLIRQPNPVTLEWSVLRDIIVSFSRCRCSSAASISGRLYCLPTSGHRDMSSSDIGHGLIWTLAYNSLCAIRHQGHYESDTKTNKHAALPANWVSLTDVNHTHPPYTLSLPIWCQSHSPSIYTESPLLMSITLTLHIHWVSLLM